MLLLLLSLVHLGTATPLIDAVRRGDVATVQALLENGADVNEPNEKGQTSLMLAAVTNSSMGIMKAVLAKNPDIDLQDQYGQTALMWAAQYGSVEKMDLQNKDGWTALMIAVRQNSPEKVRAILAARPAVDRQANSGATALFLAAEQGCEVCAAELLHLNASVDLPDFAGRTPLICAAERGHLRMVQRLRRHGARTEAVARNGQNALNAARAAQVKYCTEVDGQYADCKYYGLDAERLQATIAYLDDNTPKGFQLFKTMAGNPRLWYLMCPAIAVGTILGVIWHRYINAKDAKKHGSTGARKVALKAVARRQHWHQAFRACEVAACILLPFGMAFLWLDHFTFVPLFFVLYIFPRAIEMGAASIIARPVLLLTGLPRRQGCCDSRTPRLLGTIIFLTVTALMPWECENEISFYVYGDSTAGFLCHGPLATWMVRGIGMIRPALSRSSSQFVCPAYNAMPGWVKTVYFCFQRAIWLTAALWLLLTLLDMLGALSNQGLTAEEEDLADELHNRLLCTATAAEVQQICHGGIYSTIGMAMMDGMVLDLLSMFNLVCAGQFQFAAALACIVMTSTTAEVLFYSQHRDQLRGAVTQSVRRGIIIEPLMKMLHFEQAFEAPMSFILTAYSFSFSIQNGFSLISGMLSLLLGLHGLSEMAYWCEDMRLYNTRIHYKMVPLVAKTGAFRVSL
ncbi:Kinase D-interacting substrate of 220 kDa (Ankyrin repeat-rich membrane-spanning protein) [Durusdinium trenchii]|uniref:Kinase D-interacting substrate of 220 kDa (Ankyrin repeat-rich membrane-spanning protein) n=1 Tax=Durusdinium trenchii TaxID=1381693 RepID=A0ABP0NSP7_9DINO